jgi:hypothetical protein
MRGAGRLLLRAVASARILGLLLFQPAVERLSWYWRTDARRRRQVAAAVLAISILGGGHPFFEYISDVSVGVPEAARIAADGLGTAKVSVELPPRPIRNAGVRAAPLPPPVSAGKRTALLIGINRAKGGRPLPGSVTDATNVRKALAGYGFLSRNVTTLLDGAATRSRILSELDRLAARTPADGVAVFAVATHTRRRGGQNELLTADGARIGSYELAAKLRAVRSRMWVALPTCYAGGYAIPGIIGPRRVATFASSATRPTYQLGSGGSYLIIHMVKYGMLEGGAPGSVESAFEYARARLERERPTRVPSISDGIPGDLVLGRVPAAVQAMRIHGTKRRHGDSDGGLGSSRGEPQTTYSYGNQQPQQTPAPTPAPRGRFGVCGRYEYNCTSDDD